MSEPLEEVMSRKGDWKAEISQRDDGTYRVVLLHWMEEDVTDFGTIASFWSEVRTGASISDSIERARAVARELLRSQGADADV